MSEVKTPAQQTPTLWRTNSPENTLPAILHAVRQGIVQGAKDYVSLSEGRFFSTNSFQNILSIAQNELATARREDFLQIEKSFRPYHSSRHNSALQMEFKKDYRLLPLALHLRKPQLKANQESIRHFLQDEPSADRSKCLTQDVPPQINDLELNRAILEKMLDGAEEAAILGAVRQLWAPESKDDPVTTTSLQPLWQKPQWRAPDTIKPNQQPLVEDAKECMQFIEFFQLPADAAAALIVGCLQQITYRKAREELSLAAFAYEYPGVWDAIIKAPQGKRFQELAEFHHFDWFLEKNNSEAPPSKSRKREDRNSHVNWDHLEKIDDFAGEATARNEERSILRASGTALDAFLLIAMIEMGLNAVFSHSIGANAGATSVPFLITSTCLATLAAGVSIALLIYTIISACLDEKVKRTPKASTQTNSSPGLIRVGFFAGSAMACAATLTVGLSPCFGWLPTLQGAITSSALIIAGMVIQKYCRYKSATSSVLHPMDEANKNRAKYGALLTCLGITGSVFAIDMLYAFPNIISKPVIAAPAILFASAVTCTLIGLFLQRTAKEKELSEPKNLLASPS